MVVNESEALIIGQIGPVTQKYCHYELVCNSTVITDNIWEMFFSRRSRNIAKALKEWIFDIKILIVKNINSKTLWSTLSSDR